MVVGAVRAAPLVRVKAKSTVKNAVCESLRRQFSLAHTDTHTHTLYIDISNTHTHTHTHTHTLSDTVGLSLSFLHAHTHTLTQTHTHTHDVRAWRGRAHPRSQQHRRRPQQ